MDAGDVDADGADAGGADGLRPDGTWWVTEPGPGEGTRVRLQRQQFCPRCGEPRDTADHGACDVALVLEPPRFCAVCRRRMVVQIVPTGWTARCVEHGELHGGNAAGT